MDEQCSKLSRRKKPAKNKLVKITVEAKSAIRKASIESGIPERLLIDRCIRKSIREK